MNPPRILAFAGSARAESYNKKLLRAAVAGARTAGAEVTVVDLRDLPLPVFDEDWEAREGEHPHARRFKDLLRAHDGVLLASPENNGSYSALLKNTLDWVSRRREGEQAMECTAGKVFALLAASPGPLGGLRGLFQVRYLLQIFRAHVLPEQMMLAKAAEAFLPDGTLKDPKQQAEAEALGALLARTVAKLKG
jgi:chromate reductase